MQEELNPEFEDKRSSIEFEDSLVYDALCSKEPLVFGYTFFNHHFSLNSPPFHLDIIDHAMAHRYIAVAAPRGSSKSTLLTFVYPMHSICYKRKKFILIISNTFSKGVMALETIKKEFKSNESLLKVYGITITKDAQGDSEFTHRDGFTTKVLCKGVDQIGSCRGVKFGEQRPDLVIGDDMEDDELVKNPDRRLELQANFDEALAPIGDNSTQQIYIGTRLHDDCLLSKLVSKDYYKEYKKIIYLARIEKENKRFSIWPEKWTLEDLNEMEQNYPARFAKEMQNDPVAGKNVRFKREDFRYWRVQEGKYICFEGQEIIASGHLSDCRAAIACDLAWQEGRENDASSIMPGFLTPDSLILVDTYINERGLRPEALQEHLFVMEDRLKALTNSIVPIGFEKAMLERVNLYLLRLAMKTENHPLMTQELKWDADKIGRIEMRLLPRFSQHMLFLKQGMGDLENQLERFPYASHDDLVDALQGLVQLLKFPKQKKKDLPPDDKFMTVRKWMIDSKKKEFKPISGKHVHEQIPYHKSIL